jgi:hypothetical protein
LPHANRLRTLSGAEEDEAIADRAHRLFPS